jgi:hypothetical protein
MSHIYQTATTPELKAQWRDLFDSEPPPFNRRYLESRPAYGPAPKWRAVLVLALPQILVSISRASRLMRR